LRDKPRTCKKLTMSEVDIDALKKALSEATGPGKRSARALSLAVSKSPDFVRDIIRGTNKNPNAASIVAIARELRRDLAEFIPGTSLLEKAASMAAGKSEPQMLKVIGAVAMGVWREQTYWDEDEQYWIEVGPSPIRGAERFAVRSEGYSMEKVIPPGSDLECLRVQFGRVEPAAGDLVIVERHNHDLTELTCKRLDIDETGDWILRCESDRPEFLEPIRLGRPDADLFVDNEVRVIGIVIRAQQNHFRRR